MRIIDRVSPQWKSLAAALGFDLARIEVIDQTAFRRPVDACREMFGRWLNGDYDLEPVTWDSLIQCLMHAGLMDTADSLKECLPR